MPCDCYLRGDVGSWVREAAMGALTHTLLLLLRILPAVDSPSTGMLVLAIVCTLAKQSVERIGRVRGVRPTTCAASAWQRLCT